MVGLDLAPLDSPPVFSKKLPFNTVDIIPSITNIITLQGKTMFFIFLMLLSFVYVTR